MFLRHRPCLELMRRTKYRNQIQKRSLRNHWICPFQNYCGNTLGARTVSVFRFRMYHVEENGKMVSQPISDHHVPVGACTGTMWQKECAVLPQDSFPYLDSAKMPEMTHFGPPKVHGFPVKTPSFHIVPISHI